MTEKKFCMSNMTSGVSDPNWFKIKEIENDIFVIEEPGWVQSYLVNGDDKSILIDTGMGFLNIRKAVESIAKGPIDVVNTHWHFDHIGGNALFDSIGIASIEADLIERDITNEELIGILGIGFENSITLPRDFLLEDYRIIGSKQNFTIKDGDFLNLGNRMIEVIATPGHTRGSMSFLDHRTRSLVTGLVIQDTLFAHFEESDVESFIWSLKRVISRGDDIYRLLPTHGPYPLYNNFLNEVLAAFIEIEAGTEPDAIDHSWGPECYLYRFSTFEVLVKPPGMKGIKIFNKDKC